MALFGKKKTAEEKEAEEKIKAEKKAAEAKAKAEKKAKKQAAQRAEAEREEKKQKIKKEAAAEEIKAEKQAIEEEKAIKARAEELRQKNKGNKEELKRINQQEKVELEQLKKRLQDQLDLIEAERTEKKAELKEEAAYETKRDDFIDALDAVLKDPESLNRILSIIAEQKEGKPKNGLSVSDIPLGGVAGLALPLIPKLFNIRFLKDEIPAFVKALQDPASYDPNNPPFLMQLLEDKKVVEFFKEKGAPQLQAMIETITPQIVGIALKELGKVDYYNQQLEKHQEELKHLPEAELELKSLLQKVENIDKIRSENAKNLEELRSDPNKQKEFKQLEATIKTQDKEIVKLDESIAKSEKKIKKLKALQNAAQTAQIIDNLDKVGVGKKYIEEQIQPIIASLTSTFLGKPQDLLDLARLAIKLQVTEDQAEKNKILGQILEKIPVQEILTNPKLAEFLNTQGAKLAEITVKVSSEHSGLKKLKDDFGITDKLITDVVPVVAKLSGAILEKGNSEELGKIYGLIKIVVLSDYPPKLKEAKTIDEVKKLKAENYQKLLNVALAMPDLILKPDTLGIILKDLPKTLEDNKEAVANLASKSLPVILDLMRKRASDLAAKHPDVLSGDLDQQKVQKILSSTAVKLLEGVKPEFFKGATVLGVDLASAVLKSLNVEQVQGIYSKVRELQELSESIKQELEKSKEKINPALKELLKQQQEALNSVISDVVSILKNEQVRELITKDLPQFLLNQQNQQAIAKIAINFVNNNENLKKLGISEELIINTVPIIGKAANAILPQTEQLLTIYEKFSELQKLPKDSAKLKEKQQELLGAIGVVVANKDLQELLAKDIPSYLQQSKNQLADIAIKAPEMLAKDSAVNKLLAGVDLEFQKRAISTLVDLGSSALAKLGEDGRTSKIYANAVTVINGGENRAAALNAIITDGLEVLKDEKVGAAVTGLSGLLTKPENQKSMEALISNAITIAGGLNNSGVSNEVVGKLAKSALPLIGESVNAIISEIPNIAVFYGQLNTWQNAKSEDKKKALEELLGTGQKIIGSEKIQDVLERSIPKFLVDNKDSIVGVIKSVAEQNPKVKAQLDKTGVGAELVESATRVALDFAADAVPWFSKMTKAVLADPKSQRQVANIITKTQEIINLPEGTAPKALENKILGLVGAVIDLKKSNKDVDGLIDAGLQGLLNKHAPAFGEVIEEFAKTKEGAKLRLKGKEMVEIVSKRLPQFTEIAGLYAKGKYGSMIIKAFPLLFDKDVWKLGLDALTIARAKPKKIDGAHPVVAEAAAALEKHRSSRSSSTVPLAAKSSKDVSKGV